MMLPPAQLHQIAREERARRRAAWERGGKGASELAVQDNIIWSNIEHFMRVLTGDRRPPQNWSDDVRATMAANVRATLHKACAAEGQADMSNKIADLRALRFALEYPLSYMLTHPVPAQPRKAA
ncbi:MAG: hypothetical protein V4512_06880 [Pseudomonadota bacterium]